MIAFHRRLFAFDHWANLQALGAIAPVADRVPQSVTWLAHIMAAKRLWFARVTGGVAPFLVNPALDIDTIRTELATADEEWRGYLTARADADVATIVHYTNTKGDPFQSTLGDILTHLPIHGQHHRGQIASHLRAAGATPPVIDFIHASRAGHLVMEP